MTSVKNLDFKNRKKCLLTSFIFKKDMNEKFYRKNQSFYRNFNSLMDHLMMNHIKIDQKP